MIKTPKLRFKEFSGDWETHLLGKSITLYDNERKPVKEQERNSGEYAYYGATGIIDHIDNYIFEGEYLLLGEDGANIVTRNAPLIYKTEGKFWVNNHAHIFKPKTQFDIDFMKQRLELINYIPYNTGTAQPKLNADSIKSIPFNAPSKEEQEKIASFFSLIDNKISLQGEKVEALKDYKKGMMQKIFSRELRFKDDDGRDYPEWEEKKLDDLIKIKSNRNKNSVVELVLSVSNTKGFITQSEQFEDRIVASSDISNYKIVEKDDFAFNPARINVGSIARLKLYDKGIISPMYICFKCLNSLESDYLEYFLMTHSFDVQMKKKLEGSVRQTLSSEALGEIVIDLPCLNEQKKIGEYLSTINDKLVKEQEKLDYLNEYKKGLLQQMFV